MALAVALALEAERLVEADRRLVPREDVELELADARRRAPSRPPRSSSTVPIPRRRWLAATMSPRSATCRLAGCGSRESESRPTMPPVVLGDEDRRVRVALDASSGTAARRRRSATASVREDPAPVLAADLSASATSARGIARRRRPDVDHATTIPTPPRRGSPAARTLPSAALLDRLHASEEEVEAVPADDVPASREAPRRRRRPSHLRGAASSPRRGAAVRAIASATCMPPRIRHVTCAIAPASRTEPALPMTSRGRPDSSTSVGVIMLASRSPGACSPDPITSSSPSMLFSCVPPRKTPEPEPSVDESAAAMPVAVDDRDVRRPGERPRARAPVRVRDGSRLVLEQRLARRGGEQLEDLAARPRPPCDGVGIESTVRPSSSSSSGAGSRRGTRARSSASSGSELGDRRRRRRRGRARASARVRRVDARGVAVDAPARRRRAAGSPRGSRAGTRAARRARSRSRARRDAPARRALPTSRSRTAGEPPRGRRASPGTATEPSPTWNICVPASPKSMTTSSISPSRLRRNARRSSRAPSVSPPGSCTSRNPPPAGPVSGPSVTNAVKAAASSASTAFPPSRRTRAPASAVSGWPAAMAPRIGVGSRYVRPTLASAEASARSSRAASSGTTRQLGSSSTSAATLAGRRRTPARAARRRDAAEPRRDDRHPHLAGEPRIDGRAEDDVRLVRRGLRGRPRPPR